VASMYMMKGSKGSKMAWSIGDKYYSSPLYTSVLIIVVLWSNYEATWDQIPSWWDLW
jgi:hypothetical protein